MRVWNHEGGRWEGKEDMTLRKIWQDLEVEEVCSSDGSEIEKPSLSTQTRSSLLVTCTYRILSFCFTELSTVSDSHNSDVKSSDNNLFPTSQSVHYSYIALHAWIYWVFHKHTSVFFSHYLCLCCSLCLK